MTDSVIGDWLLGPGRDHQPAPGATGPVKPAEAGTAAKAHGKVRIWDLPTRLFHWSLAAAISGALITPHLGDTAMPWHFRCGYAALTLVLFRLMWGVVGTRHARFTQFVKGPGAIVAYLRGKPAPASSSSAGHNPLGALSVLAMLAIVLAQAGSGLFSNDDISSEGPLVALIDKALSDQISHWHAHITPKMIYALMGLHVLAVFGYLLLKRVNLIGPMVLGDKAHAPLHEAVEDGWAVWARALICLSCSASLVWWLLRLA